MESSDEYSTASENTTSDEELEYSDACDSGDESNCSYSCPKRNYFEVLSVDNVYNDMTDVMHEVSTLTNLAMVSARMLLNFFSWDICELKKRFLCEGRNNLCEKTGIFNQKRTILAEPNAEKLSADVFKCALCKRQSLVSTMKHVSCGHIFCTKCWSSYLEKETIKKDRTQLIVCPYTKCNFPMDDVTVMRTFRDPEMKVKYKKIATKEFVKYSPLMRYCPSPDCTYILKVKYPEPERVICKCRYSFCFQCGESWHDPVPCSLLKNWNSKRTVYNGLDWLFENTKCCPSCAVLTEKNIGSNHIFCRSCQFQFCWLCSQKWNQSHKCNQHFNQNEVKLLTPGTNSNLESAVHRFKSYLGRYINHCKSLKREKHLLHTQNLKVNSTHSMEMGILEKPLEILCSLRETLIYTYIFTYYLIPINENQPMISYPSMLKTNRTEFEKSIEELSRCLDENVKRRNHIKNDINNVLHYCQLRRKELLEFIHHGNVEGWWTFSAELYSLVGL